MSVAEMGISLYVVEKGFLDDVPVAEIMSFEKALHSHMHANYAALLEKINQNGAYDSEIEAELKEAVEEFKRTGSW